MRGVSDEEMAPKDLITALHCLWSTSPSLWVARQEDTGGWPVSRRREGRKRIAVLSWCVWRAGNVTVTEGWPQNTRSVFHDDFLLSVTRRSVRAGRDCFGQARRAGSAAHSHSNPRAHPIPSPRPLNCKAIFTPSEHDGSGRLVTWIHWTILQLEPEQDCNSYGKTKLSSSRDSKASSDHSRLHSDSLTIPPAAWAVMTRQSPEKIP